MDFLELNSSYDTEHKLEFRYVFQEINSGILKYDTFSMEDIQSGLLISILHSDEYRKYKLLGSDMWSGLFDRKSRKIFINDIIKHKNVRRYSNTAEQNQEFLVSWGIKTTTNNLIISSGCIFKPIGIEEHAYTLFNTKYDVDIISNTWKDCHNYKKENYTIKL